MRIKLSECHSGQVSSDWSNTANWSTGLLPGSSTNVEINGGTVVASTPINVGQLGLNGCILQLADGSGTSTVASLTINNAAVLDIGNNGLLINYGSGADPVATIRGDLTTGYAGGAWNGIGINSSAAAVNSGYALGYADAADPGNPAGLASGTIEIKYTLLGDANLDGVVNAVDFGILAANFNKGVTGWDQGDFNYDNVVNAIDFGELAANFNKGAVGTAVETITANAAATILAGDSASYISSSSTAIVNDPASTQLTTTITKTPKTNAVLAKNPHAPAPKVKPKNSSPRTRG